MRSLCKPCLLAALALVAVLAAPPAAGDSPAEGPTLLFDIGIHVEPFGATVSALVPGARPTPPPGSGPARGPNYNESPFFAKHVDELRTLATLAERHGGRLTVQAQTPFTRLAAQSGERVFADLAAKGHEIGLHFHEDAHLGKSSLALAESVWCAVLNEEIGFLEKAGAPAVRYWSGGNLYPKLLSAASCASLSVNSDWKNPATQTTAVELLGVNPWRPAGGPSATDVTAFATHDPRGEIVFLPEGAYSRTDFASMRRSESLGGDQGYFDFLEAELLRSLAAARADRVNVFHFTIHPGEFRGAAGEAPYGVVDRWLTKVIDPLVASGKVRWATFGQMADAFAAWEEQNPGVDPRGETETAAPKGYMSFVVNVHDFVHVDESADTLLRAIAIFEKHGVRGDFYLTGPMAKVYAEKRPDVLARLRDSGMTVSYHVRPPHPLYDGFDQRLRGLSDADLAASLMDYERYGLDLSTGDLLRAERGGYSLVKEIFESAPVAVGAPSGDPRIRAAALRTYEELGAGMCVLYHETGTDLEKPFEYAEGLLVRPSDFSVTRWSAGENPSDDFWWNLLGRFGDAYDPSGYLDLQLAAWTGGRPPFVTSLIHENNFARRGPEAWTSIYYADRDKKVPRTPPFDLNAKDMSRLRSTEEQEAIWTAYEKLVATAARDLRVVTSADLMGMAAQATD